LRIPPKLRAEVAAEVLEVAVEVAAERLAQVAAERLAKVDLASVYAEAQASSRRCLLQLFSSAVAAEGEI
jgi:hypothetical protein